MAKTMPPNSGVSCRICVTGMGVVSPAGYTLDNFWDFLYGKNISYEPAEELIEREDMRIKVASKIKNDDWASYVPEHIISSYGKASAYTVSAVISALNDAGLNLSYSHARIAVVMGTTMGEIETEEKITENLSLIHISRKRS